MPIGVIGEGGELRYDYELLGAGAETLKDLAEGNGKFFKALKAAKKPLIIVGQGALTGSDGAAILGLAAKLAASVDAVTDEWNGFAVLHTAASRVGGLDLGFVPGKGGKDVKGMMGAMDVLFLLGADEIDTAKIGDAFTVYIGTHGDNGAHRADVILPGAAYTEKSGTYRQHRRPGADDQPRRICAGRRQGRLGDPARAFRHARQAPAVRLAERAARQALCRVSALRRH